MYLKLVFLKKAKQMWELREGLAEALKRRGCVYKYGENKESYFVFPL
jgi:hypothetical protein